jgi:thymidylate synthase ThyX
MLTIEWQALTPHHGFSRSDVVDEAGLGHVFDEAMYRSASLFDDLSTDHPVQAAYAVSMAYRLRYVMQFNAREAMHMLELRSAPQGHPAYRSIAIEMHRLIAEEAGHKALAATFTHMTHDAATLERLDSERRAEARRGTSAEV